MASPVALVEVHRKRTPCVPVDSRGLDMRFHRVVTGINHLITSNVLGPYLHGRRKE